MRKVLSIAGSDCSRGAGIQADLKTFSAHGVFGMTAIVSVVAENTFRVIEYQDIRPDMIKKQIDAVFEDIPPDAVKIGMLSCKASMEAVADRLRLWKPKNIVIDPVMYAKNGAPLMDMASIDTLIEQVVPLGDLVTPNIPEAEKMAGISITSESDLEEAARTIFAMGCGHVLIKGGHALGDATDLLFDGAQFYRYTVPRIDTQNTHGTGCTYSSAIAVRRAKQYVTTAIAHALPFGKGCGPTHHFVDLYQHGLERR